MIEVQLTTVTLVAAVPPKTDRRTRGEVRSRNSHHRSTTAVPDVGEMAVTVGAGEELDVLALKVTICMIQLPRC